MALMLVVVLLGIGCVSSADALAAGALGAAKPVLAFAAGTAAPVLLERSAFYPALAKTLEKLYPDDTPFAINAKLVALQSVFSPMSGFAGAYLTKETIGVAGSLLRGRSSLRNVTRDAVRGVPKFVRAVVLTHIIGRAIKRVLWGPAKWLSGEIATQADGAMLRHPRAVRRVERDVHKFLRLPLVDRVARYAAGHALLGALHYASLTSSTRRLLAGIIGRVGSSYLWGCVLDPVDKAVGGLAKVGAGLLVKATNMSEPIQQGVMRLAPYALDVGVLLWMVGRMKSLPEGVRQFLPKSMKKDLKLSGPAQVAMLTAGLSIILGSVHTASTSTPKHSRRPSAVSPPRPAAESTSSTTPPVPSMAVALAALLAIAV
ncbi:unnamed protein product (mitochondrion) [Plasmodiophora brassicae]|uniref:Uncharacterized protein n=1 Tax=Plasmodiophora brassicae TaxID=37360 RepID=A0A0G4J4S0_PLABS|nr:hypothetical protein PBRA_009154 [Plasmodiophora brassicae]SPQ98450.1 unnamed protein product [Plasmodiophora brassicae]